MAYAQLKNTAPEVITHGVENRKEERLAADGSVCLILDHDGSQAVDGRLADISASGFRAVHQSRELKPGRVIRFHYEDRGSSSRVSGWARVIWSREQGSQIETGCFVVIAD
ncbi:MAG TPA: PilZ domain-containing protein [Bryobacteraceae bacterium]|jgi:hypothetical protein